MTASVQPLGEYPELPRPTIVATVQDIEQLKRRCAMLEAEVAHLRNLLDAARTTRPHCEIGYTYPTAAPRDVVNMRETGSRP